MIPGLGGSPGGRHGNQLQDSCLENSMDRGAWQAMVQNVTKSWMQLSTYIHPSSYRMSITLPFSIIHYLQVISIKCPEYSAMVGTLTLAHHQK